MYPPFHSLRLRGGRTRTVLPTAAPALLVSLLCGHLAAPTTAQAQAPGTIITIAGPGERPFPLPPGQDPLGDGGPAVSAYLSRPSGVAVDASGNVFIADGSNGRVRRISPDGTIMTIADGAPADRRPGDRWLPVTGEGGPATEAYLGPVRKVTLDAGGNVIVSGDGRVFRIGADGILRTVAGTGPRGHLWTQEDTLYGLGGRATEAETTPHGLAVGPAGELYIANGTPGRVLSVAPDGLLTPTAGGGKAGAIGDRGLATSAWLTYPLGVALDAGGGLYVAVSSHKRVRRIDPVGTITTIAGEGSQGFRGDGGPAISASLNGPSDVAVDSAGNVFIADTGNHRIRKVAPDGTITTIAGSGPTVSADGPVSGAFSGDGGPATQARLNRPMGIAITPEGHLLIADAGNHRIRKVFGVAAPPVAPRGVVPPPAAVLPPTSFDFADFADTGELRLIANATRQGDRVALNPAEFEKGGAAWYGRRVPVANNFSTLFRFRMAQPAQPSIMGGADGMAFIIQGFSGSALGDAGGAMGYGDRSLNTRPRRGPSRRAASPTPWSWSSTPSRTGSTRIRRATI